MKNQHPLQAQTAWESCHLLPHRWASTRMTPLSSVALSQCTPAEAQHSDEPPYSLVVHRCACPHSFLGISMLSIPLSTRDASRGAAPGVGNGPSTASTHSLNATSRSNQLLLFITSLPAQVLKAQKGTRCPNPSARLQKSTCARPPVLPAPISRSHLKACSNLGFPSTVSQHPCSLRRVRRRFIPRLLPREGRKA